MDDSAIIAELRDQLRHANKLSAAQDELLKLQAAELAQWQQFASYCRSCALSGEHDPQDFADFTQGD